MTVLAGAAIVAGLGALACTVALGRRLLWYRAGESTLAVSEDSLPRSLGRYSVLKRLTTDEDEQFVRELPGFNAQIPTRMRRERRVILRMYLRELTGDFQHLHRAARRMAAHAPEEHADLVGILLRQQITFWRCLAGIEVRLALAPLGLPRVDAGRLLEVVEALQAAVSGSQAPALA